MPNLLTIDSRRVTNRPAFDLRNCTGLVGNDSTSDAAAIDSWLTGLGPNCDIELTKKVYVPEGLHIPYSGMRFHGTMRGRLRGDGAFASTSVPIPSSIVTVFGSVTGSFLSYTTAIAAGQNTFTVANTVSAGDYVALQNYPTDPGGTDAYTVNSDGSRHYAVGAYTLDGQQVDAANKRQERRVEVLQIDTATSTGFVTKQNVAYDYSDTQGLGFQPFSPKQDVSFEGVEMQDLFVSVNATDRFSVCGSKLFRTTISTAYSFDPVIEGVSLDADHADCSINLMDATRGGRVIAKLRGGMISSDNALCRVRCTDYFIDIDTCGHTSGMYGLLVDTNFAEAPSGFTDLPTRNGRIYVKDSGRNVAVLVSSEPFSAGHDNLDIHVTSNMVGGGTVGVGAVFLKGVTRSSVYLQIPDSFIRLDACDRVRLYGRRGGQSLNALGDPRNPGGTARSSTNIDEPSYAAVS